MNRFGNWFAILLCVFLLVSCSNSNALNEEAINNDDWETPAVQTTEQYAEQGYIVREYHKVTNFAEMKRFMKNANDQQPDKIRSVVFTIEGAPIFHQVVYDGKHFSYVYDETLDGFGGMEEGIIKGTCSDFAKVEKERGTSYRLTGCTGELEALEVLFRWRFL